MWTSFIQYMDIVVNSLMLGSFSFQYVHRKNPPPYEEEAVRANRRRLLNQRFN